MIRFSVFLIGLIFFMGAASCSKRPCKDLKCFNYGVLTYKDETCFCDCPSSALGAFCEIDLRDSLVGNIQITDSCFGITYPAVLSKSTNGNFQMTQLAKNYIASGLTSLNGRIDSNFFTIDSQSLGVDISGIFSLGIKGSAKVYYTDFHLSGKYYVFFSDTLSNRIDTCSVFITKD